MRPTITRARHVPLVINRDNFAGFHAFHDSEVFDAIADLCPVPLICPMARHAIRPTKITGNVFILFLSLSFVEVCVPLFSMP